jgi:hypothetical protein
MKCKNCKSELINFGEEPSCKDYNNWVCPKCDRGKYGKV